MSKRLVRWLAVGTLPFIAASALSACSSADAGSGDAKTTIKVWARENDHVINAQADAFNKAQNRVAVKVTNIADADLLTKYATSIRTGDAPDIIDFDIIDAPLLSTQGVLEDISQRVAGLKNVNDLVPAGLKIGKLDGKTFSLPVAIANSQMFWNKDLFAKAGLDPEKAPASLADVKADAEKIHALGADTYGFSTIGGTGGAYTGFPSLWASGGNVLTPLGKDQKATFNTQKVKDYLGWYHDMWTAGLMPPTDQPNQDPGGVGLQTVAAGKVGIIFAGSWAITGDDAKKLSWGYADGIPGDTPGSLSAFVGGQNAGITAGSKHVDQAWSFLSWLVTSESAAKVITGLGQTPPDLKLAETLVQGDPLALSGLAALKVGQVPASIAYSAVINDANGPWPVASQSIIFQGADPAAALAKGETDANKLIADAYSQLSN